MDFLDDQQSNQQSPDNDLWNDLLGESAFGEPDDDASTGDAGAGGLFGFGGKSEDTAEDKPKKKKKQRGGLSRGQLAILGVMMSIVCVVIIALVTIVARTIPGIGGPATMDAGGVTVVAPGTPRDWAGSGEATGTVEVTPTEDGFAPEPTQPPTPTAEGGATATPTPLPAVYTTFDRDIQNNPNDIELRLQRGAQYLELGAYEAALYDFEYASTIDPERAEVYVGMGHALYALRRWQQAEKAFGRAIAFNQDLPGAHFGLGKIYYYQGRYEESAKEFDWAAAIDNEYVEAEAWLAIASARQGNAEEALGAASRAISLTEELPLVYIAHSWALRVQTPPDITGAQGDLLYAENLDPFDFQTLNALARFYADHVPERLAEAEQKAQYAHNWAENDFQRAQALHTLGRIYIELGRKEAAQSTLAEAADLATSEGRIILAELVDDLERAVAP